MGCDLALAKEGVVDRVIEEDEGGPFHPSPTRGSDLKSSLRSEHDSSNGIGVFTGDATPVTADVFGRALWEWTRGGLAPEVLEREDGFLQSGAGPEVYLSEFRGWPAAERRTIRSLRGRVLDVGCGAGRVSLELQRRGIEVVGLDASPLAVRAARFRGVREVWCAKLEDLESRIDTFDSIVMFGNNFGILGTPDHARQCLIDLARFAMPDARIFTESTNAYGGGAPGFNRSYYRQNKMRGVAPGQIRLRFRFGSLIGPWFDWLYVSPKQMRLLLRGTGWHQARVIGTRLGEPYVAVLEKD
ncbi:MAG TPA: methyltransferase domain-containing protein [Acidimicrobiales bacterium]|nr:methyltransferase domain-containing protein [Acidimicrobiales bacterium]